MMKNLVFILFCLFCFNFSSGQKQPEVGDMLIIKEPYAQKFRFLKVPNLNILNKRGVVANYKSLYGNAVIIDEVTTVKGGVIHVILKKKDGSKFFGFLTEVKANYAKAIEAKELAISKS